MYGAGNEPTSTAEVEALLGTGYIPTNTGQEIPNRIFPQGARSAGTAFDEITKNECVKRIGVVDLGTLTWDVSGSGTANEYAYSDGIASLAKAPSEDVLPINIICSKYTTDTQGHVYSHAGNDIISMRYSGYSIPGRLTLYSTSLIGMTGAQIKTAMAGVMLNYELATPVTYATETHYMIGASDLYSTQRAIVSLGHTSVSAPFVGDITYGNMTDGCTAGIYKKYLEGNQLLEK